MSPLTISERTDKSERPAAVDAPDAAAPVIGETIQDLIVTRDLYRGLDNLVALGIGPFQIFEVGPHNCTEQTFRGQPANWSLLVGFTT